MFDVSDPLYIWGIPSLKLVGSPDVGRAGARCPDVREGGLKLKGGEGQQMSHRANTSKSENSTMKPRDSIYSLKTLVDVYNLKICPQFSLNFQKLFASLNVRFTCLCWTY